MASKPRVSVTITADSTGYTAAVNKAKGQLIEFGQVSKKVSHGTITDVQAISGGLRTIDGSIQNNIRSAERYLASIKGVGAAFQLIYPGIGLIAVGALVARGVTELTNFIKKTREAGAEFQRSFQEIENASRLSNDELAKTNINLENQIAKLTGKHENVLAAELIEARIEADHLADSAAAAAKQIKDLLDKNKAGILSNIFLNKGVTTDVFGNLTNFQNLKDQARQDQSDALHRGDKTGTDAAQKQYEQLLKNERAYIQDQIKLRTSFIDETYQGVKVRQSYVAEHGNQDTNLTALRAAQNLNYDQSDRIAEDAQNHKDSGKLKGIEDAKNYADKARQAQEKAAREMKQRMDDQLATAKQDHLVSVAEEAQYWVSALAAVKGGSEPMFALRLEINKRLAELGQEQRKNLERFQGFKLPESVKTEQPFDIKTAAGDTKEQVTAQEEAALATAKQNAEYAEAVLRIKEAAGEISKLDAAQQLASIHAKEYVDQVAAIQGSIDFWQTAPDSPERNKHLDDARRRIGTLGAENHITGMQDKDAIDSHNAFGAWHDALNQFVQESRDTASQFVNIWTPAVASVNEEIVKILSTRHNYGVRREFGNIGAGIFSGVAKTGLQKAEGSVMSALGFGGKPDGTQSKPLFIKDVDKAAGAAASAGGKIGGWLNGILGKVFGHGGTSVSKSNDPGIASKAVGFLGGLASKAFGAMGGSSASDGDFDGFYSGQGFADGGMPPVGMASLVGENGPELFVPHTAGTVVPNHMLGGGGIHFHPGAIDARGASDPAAVEAAVQRGIRKAIPTNAAAAIHAQHEMQQRKAPSQRR